MRNSQRPLVGYSASIFAKVSAPRIRSLDWGPLECETGREHLGNGGELIGCHKAPELADHVLRVSNHQATLPFCRPENCRTFVSVRLIKDYSAKGTRAGLRL